MEICILQISMWGVLHSAADGTQYTGACLLDAAQEENGGFGAKEDAVE